MPKNVMMEFSKSNSVNVVLPANIYIYIYIPHFYQYNLIYVFLLLYIILFYLFLNESYNFINSYIHTY